MALRDVNLVPPDVLARRQLRRHLCFWTACLALSLSLIFGVYFYQVHVVLAKKRPPTTLKDMHTHLGTRLEEIKQVQEEVERLDQQQAVLEAIVINQPYSKVLLTLVDVMNEETWLNQLTIENGANQQKDKEDIVMVRLTGFSFSNDKLGNFMKQLSSNQMFKTSVLKYARETNMPSANPSADEPLRLTTFQIECTI
jgi:Tfp pilus assembly protein PilN